MADFLKAYGINGGIYRSENVKIYFDELTELTKRDDLSENTAFKIADRIHKIVRCAALNREETEDEWGMRRLLSSYVYKKLNLDEFAKKMHMSKSNVIRLYKKKYGITPYEYHCRMFQKKK
jgi:AraC-like DNA-binding protein